MTTRMPQTRLTRSDPRQPQLESLAGEFALLAQRRARVAHQLDLLDQQREVAAAGLARLRTRMAWLAQRMDALDPELRDSYAAQPEPPPPSPPVKPAPVKPPKVTPAPPRFAATQPAARPRAVAAAMFPTKHATLQAHPLAGRWRG